MHLREIKRLLELERYQESLVNYIAYAFFGTPMKSIWEINIPLAQNKLRKKLEETTSQSLREVKVDYQIDSYTGESIEINEHIIPNYKENDQALITWWRLDFLTRHIMPNISGRFNTSVFPDGSHGVSIPFKGGVMSTGVFFSNSNPDTAEPSEGVVSLKGGVMAYSLCPLNEKQALSQLFELFLPTDYRAKYSSKSLSILFDKLLDPTSKDKIQGYATNILGLANGENAQLNDLVSAYNNQITRLVATIDPSKEIIAHTENEEPLQPPLEAKWQLGDGVNYNIEGVKYLGDLIIVHGWIVDPLAKIKSIKLSTSGTKKAVEIFHKTLKFNRPDVIKAFGSETATLKTHYGFVAVTAMPSEHLNDNKITVIVQNTANKNFKESLTISKIESDVSALAILAGIIPEIEITAEKCEKFYRPIFNTITKNQRRPDVALDKFYPNQMDSFSKNSEPELSVIIPLYGDTRFELTQIPQFAAINQSNWEIILAVDDPNILDIVVENTERLADNYGLCVRVIAPVRNLGFSGINNFAAARAKGKFLLFLNSDCFVTTAKPLYSAIEWLKNKNNGAAGFRLHYSNNNIQHDGMSVSKWHDNQDFYLNDHPRIGTPSELVSTNIANDSARMLTAACLMIRKTFFEQVGGFDTSYLRGDFEDSDLCLKIISRGKQLGIVREHGIYHLERQSISAQSGGLRQLITLVNSNIYSHRWKQRLAKELPVLEVIQ